MTTPPSSQDAIAEILISGEAAQARVTELARAITVDYAGKDLVLIGVLRGAVMFLSDLARQIDLPLEIDFLTVSSYGNTTRSSGKPRLLAGLQTDIRGRDVLLVDDILDTGHTLTSLLQRLENHQPRSLGACVLLNKARPRVKPVTPTYVGFTIPEHFVVGYGLDYAQKYRNLPYIGVLKPEMYGAE